MSKNNTTEFLTEPIYLVLHRKQRYPFLKMGERTMNSESFNIVFIIEIGEHSEICEYHTPGFEL